jgi:hypothetical protein
MDISARQTPRNEGSVGSVAVRARLASSSKVNLNPETPFSLNSDARPPRNAA